MKYVFNLNVALLFFAFVLITSCDDDDENEVTKLEATATVDLDAVSSSKFTLFSFEDNAVVANTDSISTKWDIGFRGTTIILNGGTSGPGLASGQIVSGIFDELLEAPATGYASDSESKAITGSGGWYTYTGTTAVPNHAILPIAGKVLVLKTADGKYVKMEIISYYKGNPDTTTSTFADLNTRPASRYYTFNFIYQPDGTTNFETTK
ncbi:HmuY family protein [Ohtaekwangia koreensis]|uniref:HmuY protein n=1 Tax=Ohtaekwangia koreensis TaxID=688867 RepID=A0A1T5KBG3_9BACT|nr:HmuY family protein [Ohtaekwangia koreensis]SKC60984.1 HmuY protein [Ohtaekwangia koreensis]